MNTNNDLFLLELPYHLASWHKWAQALYKYAEQYEHYLFDRDGIVAFAQELNERAKTLRNAKQICKPDIDGDVHYLGYASISIPNEYSLRFIKVMGSYGE